MLTVGGPEMFVIILLALVMFGPKKLPELFRTVSKVYGDFRRASNDLKATFEKELHSLDIDTRDIKASLERELLSLTQETNDLHEVAQKTARELTDHASYNYGLGDEHANHNEHEEQNPYLLASASETPSGTAATADDVDSEHPILDAVQTENPAAEPVTLAASELEMVSLPAFVPATEGTVARGEAIAHQAPLTVADEVEHSLHEAEQAVHNDTVHHG